MNFKDEKIDPINLSSLDLAFVGDAVYEIFVRRYLIASGSRPVKDLHRASVKYVSAGAQTKAYDKIKPYLSAEEIAVFKRGRNAKTGHTPKSATPAQYHTATGMEALVGFLYLKGQNDRLAEIFNIILAAGN